MKKIFTLLLCSCAIASFSQYVPQVTGTYGNQLSSLQKALAKMIEAYEKEGYHGTILVAKGNQILFQKGYGIANQLTQERNDTNTIFKTESVGKLFTATLVLSEVEKGHLRLDDTLNKFFPDINYPNGNKITIHHLLTHTSGLTETYPVPGKKYTWEDVKALRASTPLAFNTPGERFQYSNLGYAILGDILEKVTNKTFDQVFQEYLFNAADMHHTRHLNDNKMSLPHAAQPYHWYSSKHYELANQTVGPKANGAGGWISTVSDFHHFAWTLLNGKLINQSSWGVMKTANQKGALEFQKGAFYTYGLIAIPMKQQGVTIYGNTGGGGGFGCDLYFEPESQYIVVNFMNMYGDSRAITKNVFKLLLGEPVDPVKKANETALGDLIETKGLKKFSRHTLKYLASLGFNLKEPREFIRIAGEFDDIKEYQVKEVLLKAGINQFPTHGFMWLHYGRTLLKLAKLNEAKVALEEAHKLGETANDERLVNLSNVELKKI